MRLFFHQVVQVGNNALDGVIAGAVDVALTTDEDRLDFAFSHQKMEQTAFDTGDVLNIFGPPEFRHHAFEVAQLSGSGGQYRRHIGHKASGFLDCASRSNFISMPYLLICNFHTDNLTSVDVELHGVNFHRRHERQN